MAQIGAWGDVVFSVSASEVKTIEGVKWDIGAKYTTHTRHLQSPLLEFTGEDVESFSFTMFFATYLGVSPKSEIDKLIKAVKNGEVNRLIIGTNNYGKFVVEKISNSIEKIDNKGNLLAVSTSVTMKSYADR